MTMQDLYEEMKRALPAMSLRFSEMPSVDVRVDGVWLVLAYAHTEVRIKLPSAS